MTTDTMIDPTTTFYTDYYDDYQEPAAQEPLTPLDPGAYVLELPRTIKGTVRTDKQGRTGIDFALGATRCVEDAHGTPVNGLINRFYRVSTLPRGNAKFSDAADLLSLFGIEFRHLRTADEWQAAMDSIAGQRTPKAIRCDIQGYYKHPLTNATVYLRSKDFRLGNGYARRGFVVNGQFTLTPAFPATVTTDEQKKAYATERGWTIVYGNFEPGYRPFGVKAEE